MNRKLFLLPICLAVSLTTGALHAQNSAKLIQDYYQKNSQLKLKGNTTDKTEVIILNEDPSKSLGLTIVNVQQTFKGLRIYNALGKVLIKDNKVVSESNEFKRNVVVSDQKNTQEKISEDLLRKKLRIGEISKIDYLPNVYFEKNGVYVLSKEIFVSDKNSPAVWHVIADAATGEILSKYNTVLSCNFQNDAHSDKMNENTSAPLADFSPMKNMLSGTKTLLLPSNSSYNVFPLPVEAPTFGSRSLVNNPWNLTSSPEGWHSDGTNNYTNTRGNNVYAYSDQNNTNTPGYSPDGGSTLSFDFPFADGRYENPMTYRDAAITNLFYMNNKMHDIFYKFGFTETARNYQTNNFNKGGLGNDAVNAEAFDGSDFSNANFDPGYEYVIGRVNVVSAPRMQMYLFERPDTASDPISRYHYNSPASITTRPRVEAKPLFWGTIYGPLETGDLALTVPDNACTVMVSGSLTGRIALIKNGGCDYDLQVFNAQKAGAIGVIVYNPSSDSPADADSSSWSYYDQVTIPSLNIGKNEGEYLKNEILAGTTINLTLSNKDYNGYKHSSLDNGVIAHEYGHGISNRLTGQGYSCLRSDMSAEQMGDGWSDYFALMLTTRPGDTSALARGMGTYVFNEPTDGVGIRLAKYSPDFSVNDYTYAKTNTVFIPHGTGFIWATMLWDLTWKYIEKYGYNSDVMASATSGNARALQIVMNGLKLQVCNPSFIDGRDAILKADATGNGSADKCMIWNTFAKRGLGVNASAGIKAVGTDQVEDFTVPQECNTLATQDLKGVDNKFIIFPNPTYDEFFVGNIDKSSKEVKIRMFDMSGKLVFTDSRESASKKAISTRGFQKGVYMVHIQQGEKTQVEKLIVR
ncbi:metalloprotease [Chryseobacterium lactis]|uniref:Metalloprotease n=1 Tax=Chryseobacterium lactis TaxID=1241981 RepID=A0A3G6RSA0_CHRLC|nr:T9SS-dependent M36 family metallopeptidase [Chryseobacterium lactis]AZA81138.1 T9SS C-terminal target domain-containing protein [Chryseobacterium lactis]AZB06139.1 T9SS C-terminal target domain-containing protein [Chryseobacterium lactis]PNW14989.1 metalloprotease [Chryseobacterium lactis]